MTVPTEYSRAADHFYEFLVEARNISGLTTTNQAYTMVQGVFQAFRRRLDLKDAILFAGILPVGLRALFVADWDVNECVKSFCDRAMMTKEVQSLRVDHNFVPDTAISDVAKALRRHIDVKVLDQVLESLPTSAEEFWKS